MEEQRAPDIAGKIRAYRAWRLASDGTLTSTGIAAHRWSAATLTAQCNAIVGTLPWWWPTETWPPRHDAPDAACECGVYATKTPALAVAKPGACIRHHIVGAVDLWGRVVHHEWGYRAEHAEIVELYDTRAYHTNRPFCDAFDLMRRTYDVRVEQPPADLPGAGWTPCIDCVHEGLSESFARISVTINVRRPRGHGPHPDATVVDDFSPADTSTHLGGDWHTLDLRQAALDAKRDQAEARRMWLNKQTRAHDRHRR